MSIFRDFVEVQLGEDCVRLLESYESLFNKLNIDLSEHPDVALANNYYELNESLRWVILIEAQDNNIIPNNWIIWDMFNPEDPFDLCNSNNIDEEELKEVVKKFEDWCGFNLIINL